MLGRDKIGVNGLRFGDSKPNLPAWLTLMLAVRTLKQILRLIDQKPHDTTMASSFRRPRRTGGLIAPW